MIDFLIIGLIMLIINFIGHLLCDVEKKRKHLEISFWLQVLILMSLSVLRDYSVGNDTVKYVDFYQETSFLSSRFEPGFIFLVKIAQNIDPNPRFFISITSIFIFYSYGKTIWRYSDMPSLSLYIIYCYTFFSFALSGIRESLAIAITLLSFPYLIRKRYIQFYIIIVMACLIHITACIFLLAPLLTKLRVSSKSLFILFIGAILFQSLFATALNYAIVLVPAYNSYVVGGEYFGETRLASIMDLSILLLIFIFSILTYKRTRMTISDSILIIVVGFSVLIMYVSLQFNMLARLALYYSFFAAILLPNAINKYRGRYRLFIASSVVTLFTMYSLIILLYRPEWNSIFPYKFFFL